MVVEAQADEPAVAAAAVAVVIPGDHHAVENEIIDGLHATAGLHALELDRWDVRAMRHIPEKRRQLRVPGEIHRQRREISRAGLQPAVYYADQIVYIEAVVVDFERALVPPRRRAAVQAVDRQIVVQPANPCVARTGSDRMRQA